LACFLDIADTSHRMRPVSLHRLTYNDI
jgi:hypothetical protein